MICYFTGTGNSKYVAEKLANILQDEMVDMTLRIKNNDHSPLVLDESHKGNLIISVPTYAWRIPRLVESWLTSVKISGAQRVWFLMTCGDSIGTAPSYNEKLCHKLGSGIKYMGTMRIIMPENYIAMFKVPKDHTARKIIAKADPSIEGAAAVISRGDVFPQVRFSLMDHLYSKFTNPIFYSIFVSASAFTADSKCVGCGKCEKLCPVNNITITDGKPVWGKNCTHCMACICKCPTAAIEYGRKSLGKPRYSNPYVD